MSSSVDSSLTEDREPYFDKCMRQELNETTLEIEFCPSWRNRQAFLFSNVDSFIELSTGNTIVEEVRLNPYWQTDPIRNADVDWEEKLGRALGNLQSLKVLKIDDSADYTPSIFQELPDWESVARVLRQVWQKITLSVDIQPRSGSEEEAFARAIRGHPTIQRFETRMCFHFDSFGIIASGLATLPALESVYLFHVEMEHDDLQPELLEDLPYMEQPEHVTTLLLSPSLRSVKFDYFYFPDPVCQAVALALKTGSPITCLELAHCHFPDGGGGAIVSALQRNSTLEILRLIDDGIDGSVREALTSVLLVNTTLTELTVCGNPLGHPRARFTWLQPFFVALRMNSSLKKVDVDCMSMSDELECAALRDVFAKNSVLEELTLRCDIGSRLCDTDLISWRRTLPFLRDNKTLKSFTITAAGGAMFPHVASFRTDTVAMLENNSSLECLEIGNCSRDISLDNYFTALESLQTNTTLKTLRLDPNLNSVSDDDKIKHLISLVKKNYGLENLDEGLSAQDKTGEVGTILRLNRAGRRYLAEDASSTSDGVEVLIAVSDDLDCLLYHLLENPSLCDIEHRYVATGATANGPVHINKRQRTGTSK
jgi:hypothetical protein